MKNSLLIIFIFLFSTTHLAAQPPIPSNGYRWVLNNKLSDEFNGTTLDAIKWKNTDATRWIGRAPGLFQEKAASVSNGNLCITTDKLPTPMVVSGNTFTHQGGHIISKNKVKLGSFIECKMKANKTFMSSTFWLINYSNETSGCQRRITELDIQECIGYPSTAIQTQQFGSNTHSRGVPTTCANIASGSVGDHVQLADKAYNRYFTYGAWWKSATEILFYLDGDYQYTLQPAADFDIDMYIKMVCETYDWSQVPADGGMTGSWAERTTFYDWVRTYTYLPINEPSTERSEIFDEEIFFSNSSATVNANDLTFMVNYKANSDKKIVFEIIDEKSAVVATKEQNVLAGFGNLEMKMETTIENGSYTIKASIYNISDNVLIATTQKGIQVIGANSVEFSTQTGVKIHQNPVNDELFFAGLNAPCKYVIHSIIGTVLLSGSVDNFHAKVDVSQLSPSIYFVKLSTFEKDIVLKFFKS